MHHASNRGVFLCPSFRGRGVRRQGVAAWKMAKDAWFREPFRRRTKREKSAWIRRKTDRKINTEITRYNSFFSFFSPYRDEPNVVQLSAVKWATLHHSPTHHPPAMSCCPSPTQESCLTQQLCVCQLECGPGSVVGASWPPRDYSESRSSSLF